MKIRHSRLLVGLGLALMIIAALDPLEGSVVILAGSALVAAGAAFNGSGGYRLQAIALAFTAVGVTALFALSAMGGVGGNSGRSIWWLLLCVPYPIGWLLAIIGAARKLRQHSPA
jgi:hypothetical protein